jgi:hypothetical protein
MMGLSKKKENVTPNSCLLKCIGTQANVSGSNFLQKTDAETSSA